MQSVLNVDLIIYDEPLAPTVRVPSERGHKFVYVRLREASVELDLTIWNSDNARRLADALNDAADQLDDRLAEEAAAESVSA